MRRIALLVLILAVACVGCRSLQNLTVAVTVNPTVHISPPH
jgi:uncharacterized protein YcfL